MSVEITTRYATTVDDLSSAWAFVMDRLDRAGDNPSITISPIWTYNVSDIDSDQTPPRRFEVVVEGMVEENR